MTRNSDIPKAIQLHSVIKKPNKFVYFTKEIYTEIVPNTVRVNAAMQLAENPDPFCAIDSKFKTYRVKGESHVFEIDMDINQVLKHMVEYRLVVDIVATDTNRNQHQFRNSIDNENLKIVLVTSLRPLAFRFIIDFTEHVHGQVIEYYKIDAIRYINQLLTTEQSYLSEFADCRSLLLDIMNQYNSNTAAMILAIASIETALGYNASQSQSFIGQLRETYKNSANQLPDTVSLLQHLINIKPHISTLYVKNKKLFDQNAHHIINQLDITHLSEVNSTFFSMFVPVYINEYYQYPFTALKDPAVIASIAIAFVFLHVVKIERVANIEETIAQQIFSDNSNLLFQNVSNEVKEFNSAISNNIDRPESN